MSIRNKLFHNSFIKKAKQRKCKNCKYAFIHGNIFACDKSGIYIEPLHLICFRRKENSNGK